MQLRDGKLKLKAIESIYLDVKNTSTNDDDWPGRMDDFYKRRSHNVVNNLWHSRFSSLFHQTKKFSTKVHFYRTFLCWYYFQITFLILLFWREQKLFFRNKSKRRLNFFHFTRYGEFLLLIVADEDLRTALRAAGGLRNFESIFRANLQWVGSLTQMQRLNLSSSGKQPLAGNSFLCNCP